MSGVQKILLPTGTAAEVLGRRRAAALHPAFPRDWLAGASAWEGGPELLHLCWELGRCAPEASESEQRALMLLGFAALAGLRAGSTRMPVRGALAERVRAEILVPLGATEADLRALEAVLESPPPSTASVLGRPGDYAPLLLDGDWLCTQRMRAMEDLLVNGLARRIDGKPHATATQAKSALAQVLARPAHKEGAPVPLSEEQQKAVRAALCQPFTAIAGGPGTGKTSIVASMLRALGQLGVRPVEIALAAPTGKAAARMDQAVRAHLRSVLEQDAADAALLAGLPPAQTLHRLLGYSPSRDRFAHHGGNPLAASVVIVDESSMIDAFLMQRLECAVAPEARLVLLGDAEQLPSVDAGAVFRDLVPLEVAAQDPRSRAAVRLTHSFRMDARDPAGRNVLTVAAKVNAGELPAMQAGGALADATVRVREDPAALADEGVELLDCASGDAVHRGFLERWHRARWTGAHTARALRTYRFSAGEALEADRAELEALVQHLEATRLLGLTRSGRELAGTGGANAYLHQLVLEAHRRAGERIFGAPELLAGEPVLVEHNDYARGLFNGDSGVVVRGVEGAGRSRPMAVFRAGEGFRAFALEGLGGTVALAHAMTVHKAQGSEADQVAILLPARDLPLLCRELLYTGLTRARRSAVVVGSPELFGVGVARALDRFSGVGERLGGVQKPAAAKARKRRA